MRFCCAANLVTGGCELQGELPFTSLPNCDSSNRLLGNARVPPTLMVYRMAYPDGLQNGLP